MMYFTANMTQINFKTYLKVCEGTVMSETCIRLTHTKHDLKQFMFKTTKHKKIVCNSLIN